MADLRDFFQGASNSVASNVSAPVDGIAWLLRKAGLPIPQNPVGGSDWMAQRGLTAEPQNKIAGLLGESFGGVAPMLAAAKAPQIAKGLLQAGDNLAAPRTLNPQTGAIVWHGSPHKFDKFDSSKIGTGEGAQAYGHGLYLAENPAVAKGYADTLSQYHIGTRDGIKSGGDFADALVANAGEYPASLSSAIRSQANKVATDVAGGKTAEQVIATMRNGPYSRMYAGLADAVEKMAPTKAGGSLYKVDLPDEHIAKMLDWDRAMVDQPDIYKKIAQEKGLPHRGNTPKGGMDIYNSLIDELGSPAAATDFLRNAGIPGIRYLDGGSRGAGQGSSNFVVFPGNEGLLSILERNGQALK